MEKIEEEIEFQPIENEKLKEEIFNEETETPMDKYGFTYNIIGDDYQILEITLPYESSIFAEAGAFLYMNDGIHFETRLSTRNDGILKKITKMFVRKFTGESLFLTFFKNYSNNNKTVGFTNPFPGKIFPVELMSDTPNLICQKGAFLAASNDINLTFSFTKKVSAGFFGGEGFVFQKISGEGIVFLQAAGTIVKKYVDNETLIVDTSSIVAFEETLNYSIKPAGNIKTMFFGGEGAFLTKLSGTGYVYLQSHSFNELASAIYQKAVEKIDSNIAR